VFYSTAQGRYQLGILPSVNVNSKLKNDWSANGRIESRYLVQSGKFDGTVTNKNSYVLTDLSAIIAKKVGLNSRIAGGYLLRIEEHGLSHRFIQQYTIVQRFSSFRVAHRLVSDQTFSSQEDAEFRLRYRISSEIPLNGESLDPGEFYLKFNNEYLHSLQAGEYDLEVRMVPILGFDVTDNFKIETGLDYRVNSFVANNTRNSFWTTLMFFIEI